jgi:hypothetical protein
MDMNWKDAALGTAGIIGCGVAVIHGVLTEKFMVKPIEAIARTDNRIAAPIRRLVSMLLQFSTFNWFIGGLALIAAAIWFDQGARLATGVLVGSSYLYGALGNFWGTRGRHPGWMLMSAALILIVFGVALPALTGDV